MDYEKLNKEKKNQLIIGKIKELLHILTHKPVSSPERGHLTYLIKERADDLHSLYRFNQ